MEKASQSARARVQGAKGPELSERKVLSHYYKSVFIFISLHRKIRKKEDIILFNKRITRRPGQGVGCEAFEEDFEVWK